MKGRQRQLVSEWHAPRHIVTHNATRAERRARPRCINNPYHDNNDKRTPRHTVEDIFFHVTWQITFAWVRVGVQCTCVRNATWICSCLYRHASPCVFCRDIRLQLNGYSTISKCMPFDCSLNSFRRVATRLIYSIAIQRLCFQFPF